LEFQQIILVILDHLSILNKKINKNEFMILNGQSGDFLTGGHLPINIISKKFF
jgi:hypothetical protein